LWLKYFQQSAALAPEGSKFDEDFYAVTIEFWYYFGGYFKGSGTLYDLSKNGLETDIVEALKMFLK
jgi:hypothetical protein